MEHANANCLGLSAVRFCCLQLLWMEMTTPASAEQQKPKAMNRHVYITERKRYFKRDVPTVDTIVEQDKLEKRLAAARQGGDWKTEAQALMQLGQVMKWRGFIEQGDEFLAQSASILRAHTFEPSANE